MQKPIWPPAEHRSYMGLTYVSRTPQWGLNYRTGHRLLCADGIIRAAELAETADTFFSTPAKIRIKGKWISGYATTECTDQLSCGEQAAWSFRAHTGQEDKGAVYWPSYDSEPRLEGDDVHSIYDRVRAKHNAILANAFEQPKPETP